MFPFLLHCHTYVHWIKVVAVPRMSPRVQYIRVACDLLHEIVALIENVAASSDELVGVRRVGHIVGGVVGLRRTVVATAAGDDLPNRVDAAKPPNTPLLPRLPIKLVHSNISTTGSILNTSLQEVKEICHHRMTLNS